MHPLAQVQIATVLALRSLPQRLGPALVTVIGISATVAVMTCILAISGGVRHFVDVNDQPDRAVLLPVGAVSEFAGAFTSAEVAVELTRRKDGAPQYEMLRGTGPIGATMNKPTLRLVAGRVFRVGVHELDVGRAAQSLYRGLDVGDQVEVNGAPWTVVGVYEDEGGIDENALAGDVETVRSAFGSPTYQSIGVQLASPGDYERFRDWVMSNPQLKAQVKRLSQYYNDQMRQLRILFDFVGYFVGGIMAVGAACGALTTLYAAVDARRREIATLRAIGFSGAAVAASVLIEAFLLAIPGALIGLALAALAFNGHGIETAGLAFKATLSSAVASAGGVVALAVGGGGGLPPAIRSASQPVAEALRAT